MNKEKFMKFIDKISDIIKKPYYYVPPCPRCQSKATGRYMKMSKWKNDNDWMVNECLKKGELVVLMPEIPEDNAFCLSCRFNWPQPIQMTWETNRFIKQQKEDRQTNVILKELREEAMAEDEKKRYKTIRHFVGKL